jgi:hypothetical protein
MHEPHYTPFLWSELLKEIIRRIKADGRKIKGKIKEKYDLILTGLFKRWILKKSLPWVRT